VIRHDWAFVGGGRGGGGYVQMRWTWMGTIF
jgi:hypothetical protein